MKTWIVAYVAAAAAMLALDALWLSTMVGRLYKPTIGDMMAPSPNLGAAVAFYLIYVAGIVAFGVAPGLAAGRWQASLLWGAAFGLVAYGTYDLTNQATLRNWSTTLTLADMAWGAFLSAAASLAGFEAASRFGR